MSFAEERDQLRRLEILRLLAEVPRYTANSAILQTGLGPSGLKVGRDKLHNTLAWLAAHELLTVSEVSPTLWLATLTQLGLDVASGNTTITGVDQPGPEI